MSIVGTMITLGGGNADLGSKSITANGSYSASDDGYDGYSDVTVNVSGGGSTLVSKSITANGNYDPADDSADGYSAVAVNVPNSYTASDEGKVVQNGALVSQTSRTVTTNGTYDTTMNNSVKVNVGGGGATILSGADAPSDSDGGDGNIYLQYCDVSETLPTGYTALGWLQVGDTAGPYINTGVNMANISAYKLTGKFIGAPTSDRYMFGVWASYKDSMLGSLNGKFLFQVGGSGTKDSITVDYDLHVFEATETELLIDDVNVGTPNWSNLPSAKAYLFRDNGHSACPNIAIYGCEIYENSVLTRNFIPAMRDSDSVLGMYDTVNDVFYRNAGSGSFVAGAVQDEIVASYAKVNGSWTNLIGADINDVTT